MLLSIGYTARERMVTPPWFVCGRGGGVNDLKPG